jgi:MSHA pilin protein MshD
MSRGFILVEVTVAYVLLTLALVALLPVFIMAIRAGKSTEQVQVATYLSQELLEEMRMRKWDQNTSTTAAHIVNPTAALGPEGGETDKTKFNDIDDFNGWTEAAVRDPLNNLVPGFSGYTRTASVAYVDSNLIALSTPTTSDFKRVVVCTQSSKLSPLCLTTLFTNR